VQLRALRSDNGGEYRDGETRAWLRAQGVHLQYSAPYSQSQNGVAERCNRTKVGGARAMMIATNAPPSLWGEAVLHKVLIDNCAFSSAAPPNMTPYEAFMKRKPDVSMFRVWGCAAYAHVPDALRTKLQPKAVKCMMVGISDEHKAWRLLDLKTKKVIISRDVIFDEAVFPKSKEPVHDLADYPDLTRDDIIFYPPEHANADTPIGRNDHTDPLDVLSDLQVGSSMYSPAPPSTNEEYVDLSGDLSVVEEEDESDDGEQPVRRSTRERAPSEKLVHRLQAMKVEVAAMVEDARGADEPATYRAAMSRPDAALWTEAMRAEVESLMKTKTFEFVPDGDKPKQRPVSAKWVYKIKRNSDGTIERYKARLVARGFTQRPGVDFRETFAPVARMTSIRALLSVACKDDMNLTHFDVDTAFLNGELDEEIYMRLPEGLEGDAGRVVRLRKGLYGLKQASRQWYKALDKVLVTIGFVQSRADPCIYVYERDGKRVMLAVYVDDFVIADNDVAMRERVKRELAAHFKLKDLGELHWCLGLRVTRDRAKRELTLDQESYILEMLELFRMGDSKPCRTPAMPPIDIG